MNEPEKETHTPVQGSLPWVARRNHSLPSALWCQEVAYYYGEQIYSGVRERDRMVCVLWREADLRRWRW